MRKMHKCLQYYQMHPQAFYAWLSFLSFFFPNAFAIFANCISFGYITHQKLSLKRSTQL